MAALTSLTPAVLISSAVITVAPTGGKAASLGKRAPVTWTVAMALSSATSSAWTAEANREKETAQASASGFKAGALFETAAKVMLWFFDKVHPACVPAVRI